MAFAVLIFQNFRLQHRIFLWLVLLRCCLATKNIYCLKSNTRHCLPFWILFTVPFLPFPLYARKCLLPPYAMKIPIMERINHFRKLANWLACPINVQKSLPIQSYISHFYEIWLFRFAENRSTYRRLLCIGWYDTQGIIWIYKKIIIQHRLTYTHMVVWIAVHVYEKNEIIG